MFDAVPHRWRWRLWLVYVLAWTTALLVPVPDTGHWSVGDVEFDLKFVVGKALHVSAFALMAVLTGWLQVPVRWRFLLMFGLMAHGTVTEMLQYTIEFINRTGLLTDVALDDFGIAIGTLLSWKWWTAPDQVAPVPEDAAPSRRALDSRRVLR
jgi:hypothetical protein